MLTLKKRTKAEASLTSSEVSSASFRYIACFSCDCNGWVDSYSTFHNMITWLNLLNTEEKKKTKCWPIIFQSNKNYKTKFEIKDKLIHTNTHTLKRFGKKLQLLRNQTTGRTTLWFFMLEVCGRNSEECSSSVACWYSVTRKHPQTKTISS